MVCCQLHELCVLPQDKHLWGTVKIDLGQWPGKWMHPGSCSAEKQTRCQHIARSVHCRPLQCRSRPDMAVASHSTLLSMSVLVHRWWVGNRADLGSLPMKPCMCIRLKFMKLDSCVLLLMSMGLPDDHSAGAVQMDL